MTRFMTDNHRRFLQAMMSHGVLESSKAKALYLRLYGDQSAPVQLDDCISTINSHLQPLFLHIGKGMSEEDGLEHYALVNMAETDITRMSSDYTDNELELFRKTMDLIVESESGKASSTDILNCADRLQTKKMKKKDVESVLDRLVQDKWLNEKRGEYALSTRCIIEMESYIRNMYQDLVKPCAMCHCLAFQNQTCEHCDIRIHLPCAAKYFRNRTEPKCPHCTGDWPHEIPVFQSPSLSQSASSQINKAPVSTASRRKRK
ncbi:hypothetical protein GJAV_G00215620 [Gymnothorax javanicus]|nr:hypothetical protein GJAV_G00215620 [Gymnothorax javanicus]